VEEQNNNNRQIDDNMHTNTVKNPSWWSEETDSAWDRVKKALQRDWDQTRHDLGARKPDTNQNVKHTVRQATGHESIPPRGQPAYEDIEPAHRFGYGARSHYGDEYPTWNIGLESQLKSDWQELYPDRHDDWDRDVEAIRYGWDYKHDK
jgi:hypothetical protein